MTQIPLFDMAKTAVAPTPGRIHHTAVYPFLRGDGVPVAHPLFQGDGGGSIPTSPLQLRFERIDVRTALQLNALWHSLLPNLHEGAAHLGFYSECYSAEFDNSFFAVAIWTSPIALNRMTVADPAEIIELRRFAISPEAPKNTASRMLGFMVRDLHKRFPKLTRFISYQAVDHHEGTIYRCSGWQPTVTSKFRTWENRPRGAPQTTSDKVRWEKVVS